MYCKSAFFAFYRIGVRNVTVQSQAQIPAKTMFQQTEILVIAGICIRRERRNSRNINYHFKCNPHLSKSCISDWKPPDKPRDVFPSCYVD